MSCKSASTMYQEKFLDSQIAKLDAIRARLDAMAARTDAILASAKGEVDSYSRPEARVAEVNESI
jgi:hypothetical protein